MQLGSLNRLPARTRFCSSQNSRQMVFAFERGNSLKNTQRVLFTKLGRTARLVYGFKTRLCSPHFDGAAFDSCGNGQIAGLHIFHSHRVFFLQSAQVYHKENLQKMDF